MVYYKLKFRETYCSLSGLMLLELVLNGIVQKRYDFFTQ